MADPVTSTKTAMMLFGYPASKVAYDLGLLLLVEVIKVVFILLIVALLWERARHYWEHYRRRDNRHVSFTSNFIDVENTLRIRPMGRQIQVDYLFPNPVLRGHFLAAAKRTAQVPSYPLMEFPDPKIRHDVMSLVRSWVTDDFREGYLMAAAGLPTVRKRYVVVAVFEQYPSMTMEQIRIIITDLELIENPPKQPDDVFLERPNHRHRLSTIDAIATSWRHSTPEDRRDFLVDIHFPQSWVDPVKEAIQ